MMLGPAVITVEYRLGSIKNATKRVRTHTISTMTTTMMST